jgi:CheY-like chemotaxis protein
MGTLLIVDEDAETREAYGALLTAPDRTVVTAENPEQALETARALHPSLILLDLHSPGIDGSDFLRRKRDVPAIAAIPTIVISATATELPEHASDLLGKPVNPTTLMALVGQYC